MNTNDECILRYNELKTLLYRAYTDFYIVQGINEKSLSIRDRNRQFTPILSHICILATQDVALTIWKVSIDNDGKANTFKQLKTFLHQKLHLNVSEIKLTLPKELEESITQLRKRFLAHNDADKSKVCDIRVELGPIENALAELRSFLNKLCCIIGEQATPLTDEQICSLSERTKAGISMLIQGAQLIENNRGLFV